MRLGAARVAVGCSVLQLLALPPGCAAAAFNRFALLCFGKRDAPFSIALQHY